MNDFIYIWNLFGSRTNDYSFFSSSGNKSKSSSPSKKSSEPVQEKQGFMARIMGKGKEEKENLNVNNSSNGNIFSIYIYVNITAITNYILMEV